jgi:hypothetical protein
MVAHYSRMKAVSPVMSILKNPRNRKRLEGVTYKVAYAFTQKLISKMYTVFLTAKVNGKKVETRWDFTLDPAGPVATNQ